MILLTGRNCSITTLDCAEMERIESANRSRSFVAETMSPMLSDRYACNFGPISIAELNASFSTGAVRVEPPRHFCIPSELSHAKFYGFFDRGSAQVPEDISLIALPFMGAFDGTSGVHYPGGPKKAVYDSDLTGGQMVVRCIAQEFGVSDPSQSLVEILTKANLAVARAHQAEGLDLSQGGSLGGAVGAAVKLGSPFIEIVQFGDCIAVWEMRDGSTGMTVNQTRFHEIELLSTVAATMERLGRENPGEPLSVIRSKMWAEFGPFLTEKRNQRINNVQAGGYPFLCGQESFVHQVNIHKYPVSELKTLILASDGLVPFDETGKPELLARDTISRFNSGGFKEVMAYQRARERLKMNLSHVSNSEAVGVAIVL